MAVRDGAEIRERQGRPDVESQRTSSMITRRQLIALLVAAGGSAMAGAAGSALAQGVSTRGVKAQPRGKPSGRPFLSRLTDVAQQAGLTQPVIYGATDNKKY